MPKGKSKKQRSFDEIARHKDHYRKLPTEKLRYFLSVANRTSANQETAIALREVLSEREAADDLPDG